MHKIELHPSSLIAGAVLAALAFVAMAPAPPQSSQPTPPGLIPARNMIQIKEGVSYVVPVGQFLVITAVGSTGISGYPGGLLSVNGTFEISTSAPQPGAGDAPESRSVIVVPTGFAIPAGAVVVVDDGQGNSQTGRAWGYLERM